MSRIESVETILQRSLFAIGEDFYMRCLRHSVFRQWREIVGNPNCKHWIPLRLDKQILYVKSSSPAWQDNLKFYSRKLIQKINSEIGKGIELVKEIRPPAAYEQPSENLKKILDGIDNSQIPEVVEKIKGDMRKVNLSDAEIADFENRVKNFKDEDLKNIILQTLINYKKFEKLKIANGWHKCKNCDLLCEPEKNICDICEFYEDQKMRERIRKIFIDLPWSKFQDVQKEVINSMPHMKNKCLIETVISERATVFQRLASSVKYGDETSINAKALVMLHRQIEPNFLTPELIHFTLSELFYDLADRPFAKPVEESD